ncbi:hypothetical protein BDW72DRAFT_138896 [Aspergillus terricola var. indicus]
MMKDSVLVQSRCLLCNSMIVGYPISGHSLKTTSTRPAHTWSTFIAACSCWTTPNPLTGFIGHIITGIFWALSYCHHGSRLAVRMLEGHKTWQMVVIDGTFIASGGAVAYWTNYGFLWIQQHVLACWSTSATWKKQLQSQYGPKGLMEVLTLTNSRVELLPLKSS